MSVEINESTPARGENVLEGRVVIDQVKGQINIYDENNKLITSIGDLGEGDYGIKFHRVSISVSSTTVNPGVVQTITTTLSQVDGIPITADWDDTFYKDAVASGNEYEVFSGAGAWSGLDKSDYALEIFNSWGLTNNANIKHVAIFKNNSASAVDTLYRAQARVFKSGGTG